MKKISITILSLFILTSIYSQVNFTALSFSAKFPKANSKLNFEYNSNLTPLINQKDITVVVYVFNEKGNNGYQILEPKLKQSNGIYKGSLQIDTATNALAFSFISEEEKDINDKKGYIVPIHGVDNKPIENYYKWAAYIQDFYGNLLFGMESSSANAINYFEQLFKLHPKTKAKSSYLSSYLNIIHRVKKENGDSLVKKNLENFEEKAPLDEYGYEMLINFYSDIKLKDKADSFTAVLKTKFPEGNWKKEEIRNEIRNEKDLTKKSLLLEEFIKKYSDNKNDKYLIDDLQEHLAIEYIMVDDFVNYNKECGKLEKSKAAFINNRNAWGMAQGTQNLNEAEKMSAAATFYAKAQYENPREQKPDNLTSAQWKKQRENQYAMYADTYAFILYKLGEYKEGLPYAKFGAEYSKLKDAEYNERYAMLLAKAAPAPDAKKIIEEMVKSGKATPKAKDALKEVFLKTKKTDGRLYDDYLTGLEESAKKEKKAELIKSMINNPSPKFALKDWDGKEVSLESLKGKVVVVDFWATWCGPCIQSMPGMKKAQEKFAGRDDVKFLFVDTWETAENKIKNAKDFMEKKNYPFYVLMDNENKMVSDFEVSGIPTKFILDKAGNIRFKSTGFEGNTDALAEEVIEMVELLGATK
jgi:thiol-disulfide isomerase/thioredoxin